MNHIQSTYQINNHTLALLPAKHIDYYTIVHEKNRTLYIIQTPFEIIKSNCLHHLSSYDGRREAMIHKFGYNRKVPIPINPQQNLFTFPTHSPENHNCAWIFFQHVGKIRIPAKTSAADSMNKSIITFTNGREVDVDVSSFVLEKQMARTAICVGRLERLIG